MPVRAWIHGYGTMWMHYLQWHPFRIIDQQTDRICYWCYAPRRDVQKVGKRGAYKQCTNYKKKSYTQAQHFKMKKEIRLQRSL